MFPKACAIAARTDSPRNVFLFVATTACVTNVLSLWAAQLWVYPDSIDYIQLAGGIVDQFDFTHELFLVRTPGYPLFLAAIFAIFGSHSPTAILVAQHLMAAAVAVLTAAICWQLTRHRAIAALSGVLCAGSLQILAYSNMVLTEIPFTLALALCIYSLIRFESGGGNRWLAVASLTAGLGYLLRPVCLYLLPVCAAVGLWVAWRDRVPWRRSLASLAAAVVPATIVAAPWMALSAASQRSLQATRCLDYVLYLRAATFDGLDSDRSAAMRDIHAVIADAQAAGVLGPSADYRDRATVIKAYQAVRGMPFSESSAVLGRAGRDLMREHPWEIFVGTFKYAAWMLLSPDPVYRFHPGASPGIDGRRDPDAELYDSGTYALGPGSWEHILREYEHHLPLSNAPTSLSPTARHGAAVFHRHVEKGGAILGIADSPYEAWMLLCAGGGIASLAWRRRACWLLVGGVMALHVLVSAFLSGPQTRYAVPIKPILCIYAALAVVAGGAAVVRAARAALGESARFFLARAPQTRIAIAVTAFAVGVELLAMSASHLWIVPTSIEYLELAKEVAENGDLTNELFLLRTPGYPLLLAGLFRVFGAESAAALFVLQHVMTVLVCPLIALCAWEMTRRKDVALLAGLLSAGSLQVIAFANQVMTETPYTLALAATVYCIVRYHRLGGTGVLALASLLAGVAYLMRPMGLTLACILSAVALLRPWSQRRRPARHRPWLALGIRAQLAALVPMAAVVLPWWIHNHVTHGANSLTRCFDFALYNRAANVERGSGTSNEQLAEIRSVVAQAKSAGRLADGADEGMAWTVWQAYRAVNGATLTQTSETIGQAARSKLLYDPLGVLWGTARYSAWMMLMPDSSYRYHPDGERGIGGKRPRDAGLFDSAMYLEPLRTALQPYAAYIRLEQGPTASTPLWTGVNEWFLRHVERGGPLIGLADSLYEEIILACVACGVLCLFGPNRGPWLIVAAIIVLQIVPSAFVAGIGPRYAVPVQPLMKPYLAMILVGLARLAAHLPHALRVACAMASRMRRLLPTATGKQRFSRCS